MDQRRDALQVPPPTLAYPAILACRLYHTSCICSVTSPDTSMLGTILLAVQQPTSTPPNSNAAGQDVLQGSTLCNGSTA